MSKYEGRNVIDVMTDKVTEQLSKIPHRKKGNEEEEKEEKDILRENKELQEQVEQMQRKLNRVEKELDVSMRREKTEREKREDRDNQVVGLSSDIEKKERYIVRLEEKVGGLIKDTKKLEREVNILKAQEERLRSEGLHIDDLKSEYDQVAQELKDLKEDIQEERQEQQVYIKSLKGSIRGEKRARKRDQDEIKSLHQVNERLSVRAKKSDENVVEIEERNGYLRERLQEIGKELYESKDGVRGRLKWVLNNISKIEEEDYNIVEDLYKKYREVKSNKVRQEGYLGEDIGYVIEEGSKKYFISLEGVKAGTIRNSTEFNIKDGTVCKVDLYKGNTVVIKEVYRTYDKTRKEWTKDKKERVERVKRVSKQKVFLGEDFFEEVHKYETLIITSKNVKANQDYFYRYGVINVVDPYSEGSNKIKTKIDKADIVVVRTDAVPHDITNYLKDGLKDKTLFMFNARSKDIATAIYRRAKKMTEES